MSDPSQLYPEHVRRERHRSGPRPSLLGQSSALPAAPRKVETAVEALRPGRRCVIAGHSHGVALGLAATKKRKTQLRPLDIADLTVEALDGRSPRRSTYWDTLVANAENRTIFIVWLGNQHLVRFLFAEEPRFDFSLANHPDVAVDPDRLLVPETLIREVFRRDARYLDDLLARLNAVAGCTPVVLGTPPVKGDDERLRGIIARPNQDYLETWAERVGATLQTVAFTDRAVRRKLWLVIQDLLRECADRASCLFVPVPPAAMDSEGFLEANYWAEDVSHANSAYGDLFWAHIGAAVRSSP